MDVPEQQAAMPQAAPEQQQAGSLLEGLTPEQQAGLMALIQQVMAGGAGGEEAPMGEEEGDVDVSQLSNEELQMLEGLTQQMQGQALAQGQGEEEEEEDQIPPEQLSEQPKAASADLSDEEYEKMASSYEAVYNFCGAVQAHGFYKEFKKLAAADDDETWPVLRKIAQADINHLNDMLEDTRSEFLEAIKTLGGIK